MKRLKDKVVLVLGSSSGMGLSSAELFAKEGAKVILSARRADLGYQAAESICEKGYEAVFIPCDATKSNEVKSLCKKTVELYGKLDLAMNCQGWNRLALIRDMEDRMFDDIVSVCLNSMFYAIKYEAAEMMKTGGGAILNVSSINSTVANNYQVAYCSAKAGLDMLTNVAAIEYGPDNIRVNTLNPGLTATALGDLIFDNKEAFNEFMKKTPLRTFAQPEEIAQAALYLLSEEARFITGAHLFIDGGVTLEGYPDVFRICLNDEARYSFNQ